MAVRLWSGDERRAVLAGARALGVERPIEGDHLRRVGGRCVFLGPERGCRLHAERGPQAKPRVCRQYPRVLLQTESEVRAGVDPGCYTAFASWRAGPTVALPAGLLTAEVRYDARQQRAEAALLAVMAPGATLASVVRAMCSPDGAATGLPDGFAGRAIALLQGARLDEVLAHPDLGDALRGVLTPVLDAVAALDAADPPALALGADAAAWAVETVRRVVFLRLAPEVPRVELTAMAMALGAVACAWSDPEPMVFGPALAGWCRAMRAGVFWTRLFPGPDALTWLATGRLGSA